MPTLTSRRPRGHRPALPGRRSRAHRSGRIAFGFSSSCILPLSSATCPPCLPSPVADRTPWRRSAPIGRAICCCQSATRDRWQGTRYVQTRALNGGQQEERRGQIRSRLSTQRMRLERSAASLICAWTPSPACGAHAPRGQKLAYSSQTVRQMSRLFLDFAGAGPPGGHIADAHLHACCRRDGGPDLRIGPPQGTRIEASGGLPAPGR